MLRAVSRKNFLRLGGVGLAGAVLLGVTGCGGDRKVVSFLDATKETTALERAVGDIIERFEEKNPNIDVLAPQNFNDAMFSGFQEVISGTRSPAEQAGALQEAWTAAKKAEKTPVRG